MELAGAHHQVYDPSGILYRCEAPISESRRPICRPRACERGVEDMVCVSKLEVGWVALNATVLCVSRTRI